MAVSYNTLQEWFDSDVYVDFTAEQTKYGLEWTAWNIGNPADRQKICSSETFMGCVEKAYFIRSTGGPKLNFGKMKL